MSGVPSPLTEDVNFLLDEPLFTGESSDAFLNAHVPEPVQQDIQPPVVYEMSLTTRLTPYRAYGSQYVLLKNVGEYVRQQGREPWRIKGPNGKEMKVKIFLTKLGKGWRKFCKDNEVLHDQNISMTFSDGVSRLIDFKILD
ncbi:uncharacterized protein LOC130746684 [Lotus japonicus]|uniref:uncharacterized protein LOC130746684 n=1 Tax=Lotus japonicus TaxID=34305 RepID=UPI00258DC787|nr:uncharacterized protein LOC130746684 [Lotus japonicus]